MSEETNPNQNRRSCPRILAAGAAALPETISLPRTNTWPNADVMPSSISKTPATLALKRGDASAIRSIISSTPHGRDLHLLFVNRAASLRAQRRGAPAFGAKVPRKGQKPPFTPPPAGRAGQQ